jgi:hypothetical protein
LSFCFSFHRQNDPFMPGELFYVRSTSIIDRTLSVNHPFQHTP